MLFYFTIYGHGGHFSQVFFKNKYHIYIILFAEYSMYNFLFKQTSDFWEKDI